MSSQIKGENQAIKSEGSGKESNQSNWASSEAGNKRTNSGNQGKNQEKPKAFTIKYKRPRGSIACSVCRSRKVRCDAAIHMPCTNCITFGCECTLPETKKRGSGTGASKAKRTRASDNAGIKANPDIIDPSSRSLRGTREASSGQGNEGGHTFKNSEPLFNISQVSVLPSLTSANSGRLRAKFDEKRSVTFFGPSSIGGVTQDVGEHHTLLPDEIRKVQDKYLDSAELEILKLRGAFLLPPKDLALELIEQYFEHVHPLMPVINRTEFMEKFNDPDDSPSLMLMHTVFLCGCLVSENPLLHDSEGTTGLATLTFFRRAKALYDANYETDPVPLLQTVILLGSFGEGIEDVTRNAYYWTKVAIILAQGYGFQRDIRNSNTLNTSEKKIWRRIWWCLFEKDRNVAVAFGRPISIDLGDCDVPMLTMEDFDESEPGKPSPYPINELQALYFIHLVKLAEVTGEIMKHQYSIKAEGMRSKNRLSIVQHFDMLMGIWFSNLPPRLLFSLGDPSTQNFYSCLLNAQYYNRLYLIHRSNLIKMATSRSTDPNNYKYPSWGISFQAARMICIVSKILLEKGQVKYCPIMFIYIIFSALMMLVYHVDSSNVAISSTAADSLYVARAVLKELATIWPVASILLFVFEKYAADRMKRAKLIEKNNKISEYQEQTAMRHMAGSTSSYSVDLPAESFSNSYKDTENPNFESSHMPFTDTGSNSKSKDGNSKGNLKLEELILLFKNPKDSGDAKREEAVPSNATSDDTSSTSTRSFPDIALVTEDLQPHHNFFRNFNPMQLFPDSHSLNSSRAQSPTLAQDGHAGWNNLEFGLPPGRTNGGPNFMDSAFINMNLQALQAPEDNGYLNDDISSLVNL